MAMMSYKEAQRLGVILVASVQDRHDEPEIDAVLFREAEKIHTLPLTIISVKHPDKFLSGHGDYMRGVFPGHCFAGQDS